MYGLGYGARGCRVQKRWSASQGAQGSQRRRQLSCSWACELQFISTADWVRVMKCKPEMVVMLAALMASGTAHMLACPELPV